MHTLARLRIMYVCVCNAVTDKQIINAAHNGADSIKDLSSELNVGTCCGRCVSCAKGLLRENCPKKNGRQHTASNESIIQFEERKVS